MFAAQKPLGGARSAAEGQQRRNDDTIRREIRDRSVRVHLASKSCVQIETSQKTRDGKPKQDDVSELSAHYCRRVAWSISGFFGMCAAVFCAQKP